MCNFGGYCCGTSSIVDIRRLLLQSDRSDHKGGRSVVTGHGEASEYGK
jgi:hypothetical protein